MTLRSVGHGNLRGNTADRKARKRWLLATFDPDLGPHAARCSFPDCDEILDWSTLTVDRYPIPGRDGGRYVRGNMRPACSTCNKTDGAEWRQHAVPDDDATEGGDRSDDGGADGW